jgi:hypothetical protein
MYTDKIFVPNQPMTLDKSPFSGVSISTKGKMTGFKYMITEVPLNKYIP